MTLFLYHAIFERNDAIYHDTDFYHASLNGMTPHTMTLLIYHAIFEWNNATYHYTDLDETSSLISFCQAKIIKLSNSVIEHHISLRSCRISLKKNRFRLNVSALNYVDFSFHAIITFVEGCLSVLPKQFDNLT